MSSVKERWDSKSAVKGVAVYSRDLKLVKSIATALKQHADKGHSPDYIVIHQTSLSSMDSVCEASVLDIGMVGGAIRGAREGIAKIKQKEPNHPIFLVGNKSDLVYVMQDPDVQKGVTRTFSERMLGPKVLTALNLAFGKSSTKNLVTVTRPKTSKLGVLLAAVLFISIVSGVAWYLNDRQSLEAVNMTGPDRSINSIESGNDATVVSSQKNELSADSVIVEKSVEFDEVIENDEEIEIKVGKDINPSSLIESDLQIETQLFNTTAQSFLDQARSALKKGYIVGPEKASALYFFHQALDIDPYSDQAEKRKQMLVAELESELSLAMGQGKYARSKSIIQLIAEIDPFNSKLESMRAAFNNRSIKSNESQNDVTAVPSQKNELSADSVIEASVESDEVIENDEEIAIEGSDDIAPWSQIEGDFQIDTQLFSATAQSFLDQARSALKKGYIVGPENASALYFFRQALDIDPHSDQTEKRQQTLVTELESDLSLAMGQGKYGRSKSIIKVISEIDPSNSKLESIRAAFNSHFAKTP